MQGIRRRRRRGVIAGINPRQNERRVEFTAHGQNQHLFPHGRCPPCARTTGAMGQPLKPVGAHAAGLHTAATGVKVGFDDNAGADHVAQCAREFLNICESVHNGKDAAGSYRRQCDDEVSGMAQLTVEVSQDNLFNHLHILTGKAEQRTRRIINFLTVFPVFFRQTELMHAGDFR